jgi:hypothetical protein
VENRSSSTIIALLAFLSAGITYAQVTTGTIPGTVKDIKEAALPGTQIVVLNVETGISRTVQSDATGRYTVPSLNLGNYRVTATHEGFKTEVRSGIELTVGRETVVDLSLSVGALSQTIEVRGEAPLVESTTASLGSLVDGRTIRTLPLNGRSYDQLALLQQGVVLTSPGPTGGAAYAFGTGKRFSVGGQRSVSNSFLLEMNGNSVYNSGAVSLCRRSSSGLVGQISYTFANSMDDTSGVSESDSVRTPQDVMDPFDIHRDRARSDFDVTHAVVADFSYPVSFRAGSKTWGAVANGWTLDCIVTFQTGMPFTIRSGASVSRDKAMYVADRPNLNPGTSQNPTRGTSAGCPGFLAGTPVGNASNWFDPCAFSLALAGTYGNLGRNTVIGPGLSDVDLALEKSFKLLETTNATFRFEMFDVLNHANFSLPNTTALTASGAANPSAGVITSTLTSSRQIQLALRINF